MSRIRSHDADSDRPEIVVVDQLQEKLRASNNCNTRNFRVFICCSLVGQDIRIPCSLVGQDIRLSPERPGFESRRGKRGPDGMPSRPRPVFDLLGTLLFLFNEKADTISWEVHSGIAPDMHLGGEVDIRNRRDFSRFDPSPGEAPL